MVLPVWKSHISNDFVDHSIPLSKCQRSAWSGKPRCWGQRITFISLFPLCKSHLRFFSWKPWKTSNIQHSKRTLSHFTREIGVRKQTPSVSAFEARCIALSHNALQASCMLHQPSPNQLPSVWRRQLEFRSFDPESGIFCPWSSPFGGLHCAPCTCFWKEYQIHKNLRHLPLP